MRFQLIVVMSGWVELVYEGQGAPFVLRAGQAVTQPPTIRHRVLRCSDGLEATRDDSSWNGAFFSVASEWRAEEAANLES